LRSFDIALAALALRAAPERRDKPERRLVPAVDDPGAALLDRGRIDQSKAALVASLWPEPYRQCVVPPLYLHLKAPAAFGVMHLVGRPPSSATTGARALLQRLHAAFGPTAAAAETDVPKAA